MDLTFDVVQMKIPEQSNIIVGQSHFIKTVEDIYETIVTTNPSMKFGLAFNEASDPYLIRYEGNDDDLVNVAVENAKNIGAGHVFVLIVKEGYPINILNQLKGLQEICSIFVATANPLQIVVAQTEQGRGVVGVIDGRSPRGVEAKKDREFRWKFLREITRYKK
ncbi:MAG: adenosine-specific kinase [Thermotogaceae bacterium]|nr:adenosine-specific kinase [Thermotogaceae bacterium]